MPFRICHFRSVRLNSISGFLIFIFFILSGPGWSGFPQEAEELFKKELITACFEDDESLVRSLISEHRLWVKPVVDQLVTDYIHEILDGDASTALEKKKTAFSIAHIFQDLFLEKSLVLATSYLESWTEKDLKKKIHADSLVAMALPIRNRKAEHETALEYYQEALALYKEIGDDRGAAEIYGALGFIQFYRKYWFGEDPQKILDYYTMALETREKVDDMELVGKSLSDIGIVYFNILRDYPKAIPYLQRAIEIREEIGDQKGLGSSLMYLAISYENNGQIEESYKTYQRAYQINKAVDDKNRMAEALYMSGIILKNRGEYQKALDNLDQALELREELGDQVKVGNVLNVLGIVYWKLGDYDQAIEYYTRVAEIMQAQENESGLANVYNNIGIILDENKQYTRSIDYLERALELFERTENPEGIRTTYGNLGNTYYDMGAYENAESYQHKALHLSRVLNTHEEEVHNLINLSNAQNALGKLDSARIHCELALDKANLLSSPPLIWVATINLGDNYEKRGEYEYAIEHYDKALSIIEDIRHSISGGEFRADYMAQERFAYEGVIHMLGRLHMQEPEKGYDHMAFLYAERSKARSFLDLLSESMARVQKDADPDLLIKQQDCIDNLVSKRQLMIEIAASSDPDEAALRQLQDEVNQLEKELQVLKDEMRRVNPRYADLQDPQPASIHNLQSATLDPQTVFLEYYLGDSSSCLWVVTSHTSQMVVLPARDDLLDPIETIRFGLTHPDESNISFFKQSGHKLYELLVQPIESYLEQNTNLVIIPDGELFYLPFEVLLTSQPGETGAFSNLPYFVKNHPISYSPSATVWMSLMQGNKRHETINPTLLAFGDPVFQSENTSVEGRPQDAFKRLQYSADEVLKIGTYFKNDLADIYVQENANEAKVKSSPLNTYNYIHFATHGMINEDQPDYSYLALSYDPDSKEDGLLHAAEIFNLDLDADLVVLSACQTGLGRMVKGEGLIGLTRAFIYAGTPSVVVSLWSVADQSTSELMLGFYKNLITDGKDTSRSLRESKLIMLEHPEYAHPFYWAPFVIVGDGR